MAKFSLFDEFQNMAKTDTQELRTMFSSAYADKSSVPNVSDVSEILLSDIAIKPQVRKKFSEEELEDLASSISLHGLLTPITVISTPGSEKPYRLICGERRYIACQKIGLKTIKANVLTLKNLPGFSPEEQITVLQIVENLQRCDPDLSDYITAVDGLANTAAGLDPKQLSRMIGKSENYAYTLLKFHELNDDEKRKLSCVGFAHLRGYMTLKKEKPDEATKILNAASDDQDETDSELLCLMIDNALKKLKQQSARSQAKLNSDGSISKNNSWTISFRKLNKCSDGLGERLRKYLDESGEPMEDVVTQALSEYLKDK